MSQIKPVIETIYEGHPIEVWGDYYVCASELTPVGATFLRTLIAHIDQYKLYATEQLVDLYNENWWQEEIGDLTSAELMRYIQKPFFAIGPGKGEAFIYFDDGGVFAAHRIEVEIRDFKTVACRIVG